MQDYAEELLDQAWLDGETYSGDVIIDSEYSEEFVFVDDYTDL